MRKGILLLLLALLFLPAPGKGEDMYTPSLRTNCDHEHCYWTTPMDITDEEAVWAMLMAPVTVISGGQRDQIALLDAPGGTPIGEITCYSQGVHVLSGDQDGWTLVETYSSSFKKTKTEAWDALLQGYVETERLKTVTPAPGMGLVADKLTQRLYVFVDGRLFTTLRISTGLPNEDQPYNETRCGEYFLVSKVGDFADGRMVCEKALRFNDGDLLHQVPYNKSGSNKDFSFYESRLGQRASHGCIRVQRKRTPEGVNMSWLWDNYQLFTKLIIWQDWEGRSMPAVPEDTQVFYLPQKPEYYHKSDHCYCVDSGATALTALNFSQLLQEPFDKLKPCVWCNPPEKP